MQNADKFCLGLSVWNISIGRVLHVLGIVISKSLPTTSWNMILMTWLHQYLNIPNQFSLRCKSLGYHRDDHHYHFHFILHSTHKLIDQKQMWLQLFVVPMVPSSIHPIYGCSISNQMKHFVSLKQSFSYATKRILLVLWSTILVSNVLAPVGMETKA